MLKIRKKDFLGEFSHLNQILGACVEQPFHSTSHMFSPFHRVYVKMIFFRQLFKAAKLFYHWFLSLPVWYCSTIVSLFRFKNLELPLRLYFCKFFHIYNLFPFNFKVIKQLFVKFLKIMLCFTSSSHIQPINNNKLPLGHSSNVLQTVKFYCPMIETLSK